MRLTGFLRRARHRATLLTRPLSIGVRAMVEDDEGGLLLVRHTYVAGWHFPGGGVDPHETVVQAAIREVREETGIAVEGAPELVGLFLNRNFSTRDHVALYRCRRWRVEQEFTANWEIAEARFFPRDALPADLSAGTRRRIAEVDHGAPASPEW